MTEGASVFEAYVSHPSLGEEVIWGRIVFEGWRLRFESERVTLEIPLVKLGIEKDESAGEGIAFYDPDDAEWLIHTQAAKILEHGPLLQQTHTRNQIRALQSGQELKRRLKIVGVFLAGFGVVALVVSVLMGVMARAPTAPRTPEHETAVLAGRRAPAEP